MIRLLLRAVTAALGFWLASKIVPGVFISSLESLTVVLVAIGVVNAFVRPLILAFGAPANALTVGLSLLVANMAAMKVADWALTGLEFAGLGPSLMAAVIVSLTVWICGYFVDPSVETAG